MTSSFDASGFLRQDVILQRLEQFIAIWKDFLRGKNSNDQPPLIENHLHDLDDDRRRELFVDLLDADITYRKRAGDTPKPEDFLQRFPEFHPEINEAFGLLKDSDPNIPAAVGSYRFLGHLGKGSFGDVYLCLDIATGTRVAIKRTKSEIDCDLFIKEANILADLDHTNIVKQLHHAQSEGHVYLVLEYIEGSDLRAILNEDSLVSFRQSAQWIATLSHALAYAHQKTIIHRDIKPDNILIDNQQKPFLTDFGVALTDQDFGRLNRWAGSYSYMSPEQIRGDSNLVDGRSDVFSLGVVLYRLLTKKLPFRGMTKDELTYQVQNTSPARPRELNPNIPIPLEEICLHALEKDIDQRLIAGDLASKLDSFLNLNVGLRATIKESQNRDSASTVRRKKIEGTTALSRYRVEDQVLTSNLQDCYCGFDIKQRRNVTIFVVTTANQVSTNQIQALSSCKIPGIVTVHDVERSEDGHLLVITESIEQRPTLSDILKNQPHAYLTPEATVAIMVDIVEILVELHAAGFAHCHLTPDWLIIDDERGFQPKILGHWLGTCGFQARREGQFELSSLYLSPEQLQSSPDEDGSNYRQADIWSMGVILYRCLTGELPFANEYEIVNKETPKLARGLTQKLKRKQVDGFHRLYGQCLEKESHRRFQSAAELHHELKSLKPSNGLVRRLMALLPRVSSPA